MVSQGIIDYIKNSRKKGMSDNDIKTQLLKVGWKSLDVDEAFNSFNAATKPEQVAPPVQPYNQGNHSKIPNEKKTSTLAIIALVVTFFMPLIGIILGIIALVKIKKTGEKGKGLAIAAIVIPIALIGLFVLIVILMAFSGFMDFSNVIPEQSMQNIQTQQDVISCGADVDVDVLKLGEDDRICHSAGVLKVYLRNDGQKDINGWNMKVFGENGFDSVDFDFSLKQWNTHMFTFNYNFESVGQVNLIKLSPRVQGNQEEMLCTIPNLNFNNFIEMDDCNLVEWDGNPI